MAPRHPDGEDATPTAGPAPQREHKPGRTDIIVARAIKAARATADAMPKDNDSQSIQALASIVNRALMLVGLVILVLGGMVGVYLTVPGLGSASGSASSPHPPGAEAPSPPPAVPDAPGGG